MSKPFTGSIKRLALCSLGVAVAVVLLTPRSAQATTITFDDISVSNLYTSISNGYQGFDWNNFDVLDTSQETIANGYSNGVVSSSNVAFNGGGNAADITSASTFTFGSAYFNAAWNNGLSITIEGILNGVVEDTSTFTVNATGSSTLETFNWSGINKLHFTSSGGTSAGYTGSGTEFAMDNLTVTTPEAGTLSLLAVGLLGLALMAMYRRLTA